ncbi:MAG: FKBP-type peptidyl-prolyl cis-trans isomerase [Bacteroidales bacterium]|nr:FKBP-type peptidyl-prolyl cis-trans isomerase [Bacteroidales bacterium]
MKRSIVLVAFSLLFSATLISCGPKSPFPGYKQTESGLYYKEIAKGTGEELKMGDIIKVRLAYYVNDSLLFTTDSLPEPAYDMVRESLFQGDVYEGFRMMHVGDSMSFMINSDSTFRKQFHTPILPKFVSPDVFLRWEVKVDEAMTEEAFQQMKQAEIAALQQKAQDEFNAYLTANGVNAQPLESGLVYVCTAKGKGPKPAANQNVKVHYTGKLLDGTVFDSSVERGEPIEFTLGAHQVIPGWDEGIGLMSKGEKGILYIPYQLAYGPRAAGPIPAYSNLIFEVELVDFK